MGFIIRRRAHEPDLLREANFLSNVTPFRSAAVMLVIVSGLANVRFGWSLGSNWFDSGVWALASLSADTLKAFAVGILVSASAAKERVRAICTAVLVLVTLAYSVTSAIGFAAGTKDQRHSAITAYIDTKKRADDAYLRALDEFARWKHHPSIVDAKLKIAATRAAITPRRWRSTQKCTDATAKTSIIVCEPYLSAVSELDAAKERDRWSTQLEITRRTLDALPKSTVLTADPQALMLKRVFAAIGLSIHEDTVRGLLTLLLICLVGGAALLGLYVSRDVQNLHATSAFKPKPLDVRQRVSKRVQIQHRFEHSTPLGPNAPGGRKNQALKSLAMHVRNAGTLNTTTRSLSKELHASVGTVQTVISELESTGLVAVQKSRTGTILRWLGDIGGAHNA